MKTMPLFDHVLRLGMTSALLSLAGSALGQAERVDIYVEDPRPVAEAVSVMTSRHPVVITYEDPRYEYAGDMQDVTEQARNPLNSQTRGNRVLVPRGGSLHANYEVSAETGKPIDVRETLNAVLGLNYLSDAGVRYLVQQTGDVFHVVPVAARNGMAIGYRRGHE